jgi:hypothetical protein
MIKSLDLARDDISQLLLEEGLMVLLVPLEFGVSYFYYILLVPSDLKA